MDTRDLNGRPRCARPDERERLGALAMRSKAYWGYGQEFLEACRAALTPSLDSIARGEVWVLERYGRVLGFYGLTVWKSDMELSHFFVDPPEIGRGVGRLLWVDAVRRAESLGYERLLIQSDPNAESFYLRLGAERIGEVPSEVQAGRMLPLLVFLLRDDPAEGRAAR